MISIRSPECQALAYNCKLDPLGASVLMSLSRVLSSVDPIGSRELQERAEWAAELAGMQAIDSDRIPVFVADGGSLEMHFRDGRRQGKEDDEYAERHPPTVWFGRWRMDFDGLRETRASVAQSPAGYLPGLEVSYQGGDCDAHYGEAVPTLEEAVAVAKERESNWHQADD